MIGDFFFWTGLFLILYAFYKWLTIHYDYFEKRSLPYWKPKFFFGNNIEFMVLRGYSMSEFIGLVYNTNPGTKLLGANNLRQPNIVIRDPETIKQLFVKDFDHFEDHTHVLDEKNITGSKIRQMFDLISECGQQMVKALIEESENTGSLPKLSSLLKISIIDQNVTTFFRNMVLDNIAARDEQGIYRPDMINILMNVKKGNSHLNTSTEDRQTDEFASTEESAIGKKVVKREWSDDEIVSQCFGFFLAAFDTSSIVLSFMVYELSVNLDIQQKLYEEVVETNKNLNGTKLTYETIQNMKYMDQVISETLRFWPPAPGLDRVCVKDYSYDDGECKFKIGKGTTFLVPVYGLHFDEKYWDDPKKFDPDRFSDGNRDKIVHGTYLPFGIGPRNCITVLHNKKERKMKKMDILKGNISKDIHSFFFHSFALIKVKTVIYHLLLSFKFEPNEKSQIPLKLKAGPVGLATEKGIHVTLKKRN